MKSNRYTVIWFDDEHSELNIIREKASLNGIDLVGFDNAKAGITALMNKFMEFDAAIVDGIFLRSADQNQNVTDNALGDVARAFDILKNRRVIPWFVLSGQPSFTKEKHKFIDLYDKKVYDKTDDEHLNDLWKVLKEEADKQPETQIRHDYSSVFELCDNCIGEDAKKPLLQILKSIKEPNNVFDDELYFTQIRIVLELMFRAANKIGLLHDNCLDDKGKVNLSESSLFLSGLPTKHIGVECTKSHLTKFISDAVKSILFITGAASHTVDPEIHNNLNLKEYRAIVNTPYLLYSLTFQLLDVLIWFKNYVEENPDKEKNKRLWKFIQPEEQLQRWIRGRIVNVAGNGFGTFLTSAGSDKISIPPHMMKDLNLKIDQIIEVKTVFNADSNKTYIQEIRLIE